jgi:hypothetical protein
MPVPSTVMSVLPVMNRVRPPMVRSGLRHRRAREKKGDDGYR